MKIQTYIEAVGPEAAAQNLGVSVPAIKHYRNGIRRVRPQNVLSACAATDWKVTPHELRPDFYPNPTDGIPAEKLADLIASGAIKTISPDQNTQLLTGGCLYSASEQERRGSDRREAERRDHERRAGDRREAS